jgi:hypothetical protein
MRLMFSSLTAGVICLASSMGCGTSPPPENMAQDIKAGQAVGESHLHIMKPGYITKQDEGQQPGVKQKKRR